MAVTTVSGPQADEIRAAYNPIILQAWAQTTKEPVYCDIYFNQVYYKTIVSTSPTDGFTSTGHEFDISDAAQEYIKTSVPIPTTATTMQFGINEGNVVACYCKFRGATISATGVITPDTPVPVQGTMDSNPVQGGGVWSGQFYIIDVALQQEDTLTTSNPVTKHLSYYRNTEALVFGSVNYNTFKTYPLSHVKEISLSNKDYAQFPFLVPINSLNGRPYAAVKLDVLCYDAAGTATVHTTTLNQTINHIKRYYLPIGIPQLLSMNGAIPFNTSVYYYVVVTSITDGNQSCFVSPRINIVQPCDNRVRIWFRNNLGSFDQVNFRASEETLTTSSGIKQINKGAFHKFNPSLREAARSNEVINATGYFTEKQIPFIKELLASSLCFIEKNANDEGYLQLFPIRIIDNDFNTLKYENRYEYQIDLSFEMAVANNHNNGDYVR